MREEQLLTIQRHSMRHADVTHRPAWPRGLDGLHHRLLRAHALEDGVGADTLRELLDALDTPFAALSDDVGCAELAGELLPGLVPAHRDDPLGAHLLRREHAEQSD